MTPTDSPAGRDAQAWLVDLDGTLYHQRPVQLLMGVWLLAAAPGAVRAIRAFRRAHEELRGQGSETQDPWRAQLERAAGACELAPEALETLVRRWMVERPARRLFPFRRRDLLAEIAAFRAAGGKTALVSDYPARAKLAGLRAEHLFDVVVANGEPGGPPRLKPEPDGYLAAAARLGIPPGRCLVIGDRPDADGEAARRAGMGFRQIGGRGGAARPLPS